MARIGTDEWVAEEQERIERPKGIQGALLTIWERVPIWAKVAPLLAFAAGFPLLTGSEYKERVALLALIYVLLALGLNVVVGWAGLLDLGYIAFFGFGAYVYALLSSDQFDVHWPATATLPVVLAASAILGLVLGLPSRRLAGDYLAIVTLFFAQIFFVLTTNGDVISLPFTGGPHNVTNGPNGITDVDPIHFFGIELSSVQSYVWFTLSVTVIVLIGLHFLNDSRTGRAWRALREDALAAELMGMPISWLKLLAFAAGAATAGFTGAIFASVQINVFPTDFGLPLLITVYSMVILGGAGSLPGVVLGAVIVNTVLEVLRTPGDARVVFYGALAVSLIIFVRPWWKCVAVMAATIVFGITTFAIIGAVRPAWTSGTIEGGLLAELLDGWVVHPADPHHLGNVSYVLLIVGVIGLTFLRGRLRTVALVPVLYLAAFAWENRLVLEPSVTRLILLGVMLIVLMAVRPAGLLGQRRVEIL